MYRFGFGLAALAVAAVFLVSNASSQPPGGKDGKDGKGGVPRFELGQVIPPPLRAEMKLTPEQEKQIDDLKNELKGKLSKILTPEQIKAAVRITREEMDALSKGIFGLGRPTVRMAGE